ncbi:MAG: hypothetical protein NZ610_05910 [Candidatus Bipolaricaulota bacterium]|nr:hypothetical protein [Candidatus Bipolaricaulota bacterium]MCS7274916.1 hypothetical protein [Candidatus Bipolaricaulota bacterium]MDW8110283.1 hypothetical protein [Candidatus Bipolaricaulota bacterium]MDW8328816.1 hypothetical protein [Candidatus Bipolaricaulota bacterium]
MKRSFTALLLFALGTVLVGCEGSYRARLTISSLELPSGASGIVQIRVLNPPDLKTLQIGPVGMFLFDPTVIQITAIDGINGFTILGSTINNGLGTAQFSASFIGGSIRPILTTPWSMIEIPIVELTVQAVGPVNSQTDLTITQIDLCLDRIGQPITLGPSTLGKVVIVPP